MNGIFLRKNWCFKYKAVGSTPWAIQRKVIMSMQKIMSIHSQNIIFLNILIRSLQMNFVYKDLIIIWKKTVSWNLFLSEKRSPVEFRDTGKNETSSDFCCSDQLIRFVLRKSKTFPIISCRDLKYLNSNDVYFEWFQAGITADEKAYALQKMKDCKAKEGTSDEEFNKHITGGEVTTTAGKCLIACVQEAFGMVRINY